MVVKEFKAIGITCGIGSMLLGARQAGFKIVGNVEWRNYYRRLDANGNNTFLRNFPGAFLVDKLDSLMPHQKDDYTNADLALGHPECGNFSALSFSNKNKAEKELDPGDIPLFVDMVATFKPKFFVMDDLPRSFGAFPMSEYHQRLPEYDLFPEWIDNYGYGNVQLNRKRMFMIGSLKSEKWTFRPSESDHENTTVSVIQDLQGKEGKIPNHDPHQMDSNCSKMMDWNTHGSRGTWADCQKVFEAMPEGPPLPYVAKDGDTKVRMGFSKAHKGHAHVLTGSNAVINPLTNLPFSIRERARIQGFPDDFVFYGTKINPDGTWDHDKNQPLVRQTGKAMPIQFNRYVATQIMLHLKGEESTATNQRTLKPNGLISDAKKWYCENVGYAEQKKACQACWLHDDCNKSQAFMDPMAATIRMHKKDKLDAKKVKSVSQYQGS
jgi:DNA (cytosine-5)-methyltransferase 1